VQGANSGDGYVHGVEAEAYWRFNPQFTLFGNVTWMEGRVDSFLNVADPSSLRRGALSRVQPLTGLVGVRFDDPTRTFWAETTVQMAAKADHLSPGDQGDTQRIPPGGTPGWAVWSVRGGVRITTDFSITAAVENLTDEDYRIHGSGQNQPGRNFILAGELKF
jgi:hemoglobin/transferrin/lactoferrin receptor protein